MEMGVMVSLIPAMLLSGIGSTGFGFGAPTLIGRAATEYLVDTLLCRGF